MSESIVVEISRSEDGTPWSTVIVRQGPHLLFTASHRDVITAFCATFHGVKWVCVFHGDSLQDSQGRFFLGHKPTVCTSYNVASVQPSQLVLHGIVPHHIVPGRSGVYIFGERVATPLSSKHNAQPQLLPAGDGSQLSPAHDGWWMPSPVIFDPILVVDDTLSDSLSDSEIAGDNKKTPFPPISPSSRVAVALEAHLIGEWSVGGQRVAAALTADGFIRMALTTLSPSAQSVQWEWLPCSIRFELSAERNVTVTASNQDDGTIGRQVLFVFSEADQKVVVYRTPDLRLLREGADGAQCGSFEKLLVVVASSPAFTLPLYPVGFVQPVAVVGLKLELYCPHELARCTETFAPIAQLQFPALTPEELVSEVLSISGCSLRAVVFPSMEVRTLEVPHMSLTAHPLLNDALQALLCTPTLPVGKVYELLHFILAGLWQAVNEKQFSSTWSSWEGLATCLKHIFVSSIASPEEYDMFCKEAQNQPQNTSNDLFSSHSHLENTECAMFPLVDPCMILEADIDAEPSRNSRAQLWNQAEQFRATHASQAALKWSVEQCAIAALSLHCFFESLKVQSYLWNGLVPLGDLLADLFAVLGLQQFVRYHATLLCKSENDSQILRAFTQDKTLLAIVSQEALTNAFGAFTPPLAQGVPFNINHILLQLLEGRCKTATLVDVSKQWLRINAPLYHPIGAANELVGLYEEVFAAKAKMSEREFRYNWWDALVRALVKRNLTPHFIRTSIAVGAAQPILRALQIAKENADDLWSDSIFEMIGRLDKIRSPQEREDPNRIAAEIASPTSQKVPTAQCSPADPTLAARHSLGDSNALSLTIQKISEDELLRLARERAIGKLYHTSLIDDDGVNMDAELSKHWADARLDVVQSLLNTATPIALPGRGDGSDAVHVTLKALTRRAMSLPVARGMLTFGTRNFRVRDIIPIPNLNLDGRTSDGITISNDPTQVTPEAVMWPKFHNGCAAGLRFLPIASVSSEPILSRHWVVYQTRGAQSSSAKAGLLFAAGLLGHLSSLQLTDIYTLLSPIPQAKCREAATISVILGLACSFRATRNDVVFRCFAVHLQSLNPVNEDLDVSIEVQTCALFAIGLLCQGSEDSFLVEMLLNEMSRQPSDEHYKHRKGYSLGAGVSLGLILLGKGRQGIRGLDDHLLNLMTGARRCSRSSHCDGVAQFEELLGGYSDGHFLTKALLHKSATSYPEHCNRILEGEHYNINISGPAAVMALGLIYLKTNDNLMAFKILPTDTLSGMEAVFPDHCLLRTCVSSLILWDSVEPHRDWLLSRVPRSLLQLGKRKDPLVECSAAQLRYLMMNLGFAIGGAVLAMGLRFVGSMNYDARSTILAELKGFLAGNIGSSGIVMNAVQKSTGTFEPCLSACAVALSLVMAGTGDSVCLQTLRKMLKRGGASFGSSMAVSMSIGILFLGGGRLTLSNSTESIASMLIALYPVWPRDSTDNSVHLQALRHLYALAVEPRLFQTVDAVTNQPVSVHIRVSLSQNCVQSDDFSRSSNRLWTPQGKDHKVTTVNMVTPCLLPDLSTVTSIEIRSSAHYNLTLKDSKLLPSKYSSQSNGNQFQVKVLSKEPVDGHQSATYLLQRHFTDHIHLLFALAVPSAVGMVIIDNIKMLFAASDSSFFSNPFDSAAALSSSHAKVVSSPMLDVVESLRRALGKRYGCLFTNATVNDKRTERHPLRLLVVDRLSPVDTMDACLHQEQEETPVDTAFINALHAVAHAYPDQRSLSEWLTQALHYFGLALFSTETTPTILRLVAQLDAIPPEKRKLHILKFSLSDSIGRTIPLDVLEKVVSSCL